MNEYKVTIEGFVSGIFSMTSFTSVRIIKGDSYTEAHSNAEKEIIKLQNRFPDAAFNLKDIVKV